MKADNYNEICGLLFCGGTEAMRDEVIGIEVERHNPVRIFSERLTT